MTQDEQKQQLVKAEQAAIDAAKVVTDFLDNPVIIDAFRTVEKQYLDAFDQADTDDKRRTVWAQTRALRDVATRLKGVQQSGNFAQIQRSTREAAEDRRRRATTRR